MRLRLTRIFLAVPLVLLALIVSWFPVFEDDFFSWKYDSGQSSRLNYALHLHDYPQAEYTVSDNAQTPILVDGQIIPAMLPFHEARALCADIGLKMYPKRDRKRKVYDLFIVGTEIDWAEIRLETLADEVDYFVVLEATRTFTNKPKPLYFKQNWTKFAKFESQIIYHVLNDDVALDYFVWDREHYQRDALITQVFPSLLGSKAPVFGDVLIISDVDEIPRPETVVKLRNCDIPDIVQLMSRFFLYSFQWQRADMDWYHPQATYWQGNETILPESVRMGETKHVLDNAAWHCTTCFASIAEFVNKITSFSHVEFDKPEFKDPAGIVRRVRNGTDVFDRNFRYKKIEQDKLDLPRYVLEHKEQFAYLIDRDPLNANFVDFDAWSSQIDDKNI